MKKTIFGLIISLAITCGVVVPVGATRVKVGDDTGNTVQFSSEGHVVSSVDCKPMNGGDGAESEIKYRVVGETSGVKQTAMVTYVKIEGDSPYTMAWCDQEEDKIIATLVDADIAMYSGVGERNLTQFAEVNSDCSTSILTWINCGDETGVGQILSLVINIMTAGVVVLAIVGITVSGIQWLTARDNEAQVVKAKSRIFNVVIGLGVWAVMWVVLNWLLPGGLEF